MFALLFGLSFWPWLLFGFAVFGLGFSARHENLVGAAVVFIVYAVAAYFLFGVNSVAWFIDHPWPMALFALGYVFAGILWSLIKWTLHIRSSTMQSLIRDGLKEYNEVQRGVPFRESIYFPSGAVAMKNRDRISAWIVLWPFSALAYAVGDLLGDALRGLVNMLGGTFDRITEANMPK